MFYKSKALHLATLYLPKWPPLGHFFLATTQTYTSTLPHMHTHSEHTRADQLGHYNRSGSSKSVSHDTQLSLITLSQLSIKPNCLTAAPGPSPELRQTLARMVRTLSFLSSLCFCHTHTHTHTRWLTHRPCAAPEQGAVVCVFLWLYNKAPCACVSFRVSAEVYVCVCWFSLVIPAHKSI